MSSTKARAALRTSARFSAELLLIFAMLAVTLWLLGRMWSVVWPLVVGLLLTTLTWPLARFLRRHGWKPALAASAVTVLSLLVAGGVVALIAVPVASQSGDLTDGVVEGIQKLRDWASGPPLNIGDDDITKAMDSAVARAQDGLGSMVAARGWATLGSFVRSQAAVGLLDAVLIGLGLWVVGVPLVLPLAVLTFVSAFVPIIGALFAGFVAVLIALVFNGLTDALIVLAIIIVVQQLEGNVFQPMIQSRGLGLHAAVILLAVTLGGSLAGIVGSLLAVPIAALIAVVWNYVREQLSEPSPEPVPEG
jgi:predicted PurR-regulated permease PerM